MNQLQTPDRKFLPASELPVDEQLRAGAQAFLPAMLETLIERGIDPTATTKTVMEVFDRLYEVAGYKKRLEEKSNQAVTIIFESLKSGAQHTIIEAEEEPVATLALPEDLPPVPAHLAGRSAQGNLAGLLDDDETEVFVS